MNLSYRAFGEEPEVYVAYGKTPAKCLNNMRKILRDHEVDWWSSANVQYLEDEDLFYMTIYI